MSSGDKVPEVMMTLLNLSKTGLIAIAASRHLCETVSVIRHQNKGL